MQTQAPGSFAASSKIMSTTSIPSIDLTQLADGDDEGEYYSEASNCVNWGDGRPGQHAMAKITCTKIVRNSRLRRPRSATAEILHMSFWSRESLKEYRRLQNTSKQTYIGSAANPFFENALFVCQNVKVDEFICLYYGKYMSYAECHARQNTGRPGNFTFYIGRGVVVDALGFPYGAGMANHSCEPNAELCSSFLPGWEKAPYGYIKATKDIPIGSEVEVPYGYLNHLSEGQLTEVIQSGNYTPCRCLKPSCRKVFLPGSDVQ